MLNEQVAPEPDILGELMAKVQEDPAFQRAYCTALGAITQFKDENARFHLDAFIADLWIQAVAATSRVYEEAWVL